MCCITVTYVITFDMKYFLLKYAKWKRMEERVHCTVFNKILSRWRRKTKKNLRQRCHLQALQSGAKIRVFKQNTDIIKFWLFLQCQHMNTGVISKGN